MNLREFCSDYQGAIERLEPLLLVRHESAETREHVGYSLEQLLMDRDLAVREAQAAHQAEFIALIESTDRKLGALHSQVYELLGVDVARFMTLGMAAEPFRLAR
jgi:arginine deiminase